MSLDVKYINCFLIAISDVFKTMLSLKVHLDSPQIKQDNVPIFNTNASIELSGNIHGTIVISFSKGIALKLASAMLMEDIKEINEDCLDALGEIANIITGSAKTNLPGDQHTLSIPKVYCAKHELTYPKGLYIISIPCETSAGRFMVDIALTASQEPVPAIA